MICRIRPRFAQHTEKSIANQIDHVRYEAPDPENVEVVD